MIKFSPSPISSAKMLPDHNKKHQNEFTKKKNRNRCLIAPHHIASQHTQHTHKHKPVSALSPVKEKPAHPFPLIVSQGSNTSGQRRGLGGLQQRRSVFQRATQLSSFLHSRQRLLLFSSETITTTKNDQSISQTEQDDQLEVKCDTTLSSSTRPHL